jgi:hypothetical protein
VASLAKPVRAVLQASERRVHVTKQRANFLPPRQAGDFEASAPGEQLVAKVGIGTTRPRGFREAWQTFDLSHDSLLFV